VPENTGITHAPIGVARARPRHSKIVLSQIVESSISPDHNADMSSLSIHVSFLLNKSCASGGEEQEEPEKLGCSIIGDIG
jgi:hypothetical protein